MLTETEAEINRITMKISNSSKHGLASIALYFLALLSILLRPFYEETVKDFVLLNIMMFVGLFLGFSSLFKLMNALEN